MQIKITEPTIEYIENYHREIENVTYSEEEEVKIEKECYICMTT